MLHLTAMYCEPGLIYGAVAPVKAAAVSHVCIISLGAATIASVTSSVDDIASITAVLASMVTAWHSSCNAICPVLCRDDS